MKMNIDKLVSIIIPARNAGKYLSRCIQSCLEQTHRNIEILIVDNASDDDSGHIAAYYASAYSHVKLFTSTIKGVTVARNKGLLEARGDFVFFLDADDEIPSNAIEKLLNKAIMTGCEITIGVIEHIDEDGQLISLLEDHGDTVISNIDRMIQLRKTFLGHLCGILYKRELFAEQLFCPNELKIGEDLLQTVQLLIKSSRIATIPNIVYRYIRHANSVMNSRCFSGDVASSDKQVLLNSLQQLKNIIPENRCFCSEIDLLSLFSILNVPSCNFRNNLVVNNLALLFKIVVANVYNVKKLCNISVKFYIGIILHLIKIIITSYKTCLFSDNKR